MPFHPDAKLSKSAYLSGMECERRMWFDAFEPQLAKPLAGADRSLLEEGQEVGKLARQLYPGGVVAWQFGMSDEEAAGFTQHLIQDGATILFEPTILVGGRAVRCDVLYRRDDGRWVVDEVKASTVDERKGPKEEYIDDLAYQYATLQLAGFDLASAGLVLLNRAYVWDGGEHPLRELFVRLDLTTVVRERQDTVETHATRLAGFLESDAIPEVIENTHCKQCSYADQCLSKLPSDDVLYLPYASRRSTTKLRAQGYHRIGEIPEGMLTDSRMVPAYRALVDGGKWVGPGLESALAKIQFPAVFIDFEAHQTAIPSYIGTKPYATICFQWSCHELASLDATPKHSEFLWRTAEDPRPEFCRTLWDAIQDATTVVIYSNYEVTQAKAMVAAGIPYANHIFEKLDRSVVDLEQVVRGNVFLTAFKYRTSIKTVLPALVPSMSYEGMEVGDGAAAMMAYQRMISPATTATEAARIAESLLEYCCQDTLAMVEVYRALRALVEG